MPENLPPERELVPGRNWVYLSDLLGYPSVPVEVAQIMRRVIDKMLKADLITYKGRLRALEYAFVVLEQELDS